MFTRIQRWLSALETGILVGIFLTMLGMAAYQVIARNVFHAAVFWGDDLVRMAVLWVTMVGGVVAAKNGNHIRIDILVRWLPESFHSYVQRVAAALTVVICMFVGWVSIEFVGWEILDQNPGVGAVPSWVFALVIPVSAFLIALRYAVLIFKRPEPTSP